MFYQLFTTVVWRAAAVPTGRMEAENQSSSSTTNLPLAEKLSNHPTHPLVPLIKPEWSNFSFGTNMCSRSLTVSIWIVIEFYNYMGNQSWNPATLGTLRPYQRIW